MRTLLAILTMIYVPAYAAGPCLQEATQEAHKVTGDQSQFVVLRTQKLALVSGLIYQYAFFTKENYAQCKAKIAKKDYSCNSAIVDVFNNTYEATPTCSIVDSQMGDGNG